MKNNIFHATNFVFAGFAANFARETDKNIERKEVFARQRLGNYE